MSTKTIITNTAHKDMPLVLCKYRDWSNNYHRKLLIERELYFAKASEFNDPYDAAIPFRFRKEDLTKDNIFSKYYEMAKSRNPSWSHSTLVEHAKKWAAKNLFTNENHLNELNEWIQSTINKKFGIVSFSLFPDNILLWSHYSNSHRGFCVGFNTKRLYEFTKAALHKVFYEHSFPEYKLKNESLEMIGTMLSTKSPLWEYEQEYRLIKSQFAGKPMKLPLNVFEYVILGCKMLEEHEKEITTWVFENMKEVKLYRSFTCKSKFELHFEQIS
jgi:hypothetical protein